MYIVVISTTPEILSRQPCEKAIPGNHTTVHIITIILCSCSCGYGYNTEHPVTVETAIQIDFIPAGVHNCYPTRSDLPGHVHLVRECPTEAIRHVIGHPRLNREADMPV